MLALRTIELGFYDLPALAMDEFDGSAFASRHPTIPPRVEYDDQGKQIDSLRRQSVFIAARPLLVQNAHQDTVTHELAKPMGQAMRSQTEVLLKGIEAADTEEDVAHDHQRPALADDGESARDRAFDSIDIVPAHLVDPFVDRRLTSKIEVSQVTHRFRYLMHSVTATGAGFLIAVLWFDLMFDVQTRSPAVGELSSEILASISGYYRRVTVEAWPMNRLIAVVMIVTLLSIVVAILDGDEHRLIGLLSLVSAGSAIGLARVRTVPLAMRLGKALDSAEVQSALARTIFRDHLFCLAAILLVLILQLSVAV